MRHRRRGRADAGQPAALRRAAAAAAPRPGRGGHRHQRGHDASTCTRRAGHGARRVPHAQHARLPGNIGHRPLPLSDRGLGVLRGEAQPFYVNSPFGIVLGAQRQPDQHARSCKQRAVPARPPPRQHQFRLRGAAQRARARARARRAPATLDADAIFAAVAGVHRRVPRRLRGRGA